MGDWKLFLKREGAELDGVQKSQPATGPTLFNLVEDIGETTDLSAKYPEKVSQLEVLARKKIEEIHENVIPLSGHP